MDGLAALIIDRLRHSGAFMLQLPFMIMIKTERVPSKLLRTKQRI